MRVSVDLTIAQVHRLGRLAVGAVLAGDGTPTDLALWKKLLEAQERAARTIWQCSRCGKEGSGRCVSNPHGGVMHEKCAR